MSRYFLLLPVLDMGWMGLAPSYRVSSSLLLSYSCSHGLVQPQPGCTSYHRRWRTWQVCANSTPSQPRPLCRGACGCWATTSDHPASKGLMPQSPQRGAPPRTHPAWALETAIQIPAGTTSWCKDACTV